MFTLNAFAHFVDGLAAMRRLNDHDHGREIGRLPPELRKDIGYPDSCTARMGMRGHRAACHERW